MKNNRRHFYIFDLEVAARKAGATLPTMNSLIPIFERMKNEARTYAIRDETAILLIGDLERDAGNQFITLLVRLSDKTTPNSVYSDPLTGDFDEHVKTGNKGSDFGCHVLISTAPEKGRPSIYTCAIERVPGLPFDLVRRLLSKLLNYEFHDHPLSFSYPYPGGGLDRSGRPRTDRCCPHVELRGRLSDTLIADINAGRLSGVSLIKAEQVTPIAGASYLTKSKSELKLNIDHQNLPANLWASLKKALRKNSSNYGSALIKYPAPNSSRTITVEIDAATGTLLSENHIKSFELNKVYPLLAQSAKTIVKHLRDLAAPHFLANRTT